MLQSKNKRLHGVVAKISKSVVDRTRYAARAKEPATLILAASVACRDLDFIGHDTDTSTLLWPHNQGWKLEPWPT